MYIPRELLGYIVSIAVLSIASYQDIRNREVDPRIWLFSGIVGLAMLVPWADQDTLFYLCLGMVSALIVLLLVLTGLMGFADFLAMVTVSLLVPTPLDKRLVLPPSIVVLLVSNILLALYSLPMSVRSLRKIRFIRAVCGSLTRSLVVALTGSVMSIEEFSKTRFMYPLVYPSLEDNRVVWRCRSSYDINEDPGDYKRRFEELVERGLVDKRDLVVASWGAPFIVFILIATVLYPIASIAVETVFRLFLRL